MLSSVTWIIILIVLLVIKHIYILPKEDKQLFDLYEARDKISIAAMKNEISQDSIEYKFVIDNINFWISNTHNGYDFSVAMSNIVNMPKMKKSSLDKLINTIWANDVLRDGFNKVSIYKQRLMRIKGIVFLNTTLFSLEVLLAIVNIGVEVGNFGHKAARNLSDKLKESRKIKTTYEYYSTNVLGRRM